MLVIRLISLLAITATTWVLFSQSVFAVTVREFGTPFNPKNGSYARSAAKLCGVNRNTAILYFHKLRELIAEKLTADAPDLMAGEIEVDESYFGGVRFSLVPEVLDPVDVISVFGKQFGMFDADMMEV